MGKAGDAGGTFPRRDGRSAEAAESRLTSDVSTTVVLSDRKGARSANDKLPGDWMLCTLYRPSNAI